MTHEDDGPFAGEHGGAEAVEDAVFRGVPGERDLADARLWARSTERAQRNRRLAEISYRARRRRKATTVALTGAVATSPVVPMLPVAQAAPDAPSSGKVDPAGGGDGARAAAVLLQFGSTGDQVAQVQRRLSVDDDGIYGPITERAVKRFQSQHGLGVTGVVDARTWAAIFQSKVVFMKAADVPAVVRDELERAPRATTGTVPRVARTVDTSRDSQTTSSTARGDATPAASRELGREIRAQDRATPEPRTAPAALGGDCGTVTPVKGTVTGSYGEDRGSHAHGGQDIAAPTGTAVRAASCGRVTTAGADSGGYGNLVCIEHEGGRTSCYAHLSTIATEKGANVKAGQVIGTVGCTGRCTGPHLHFEVRENGRTTDPRPYLEGTSELSPAAKSRMAAQRDTGSSTATASAKRTRTTYGGSFGAAGAPDETAVTATAAGRPAAPAEQAAPAPEQPAPAAEQPAPAEQAAPAAAPAPAPQAAPAAEQPAPVEQAAPAPAPAPAPEPAPAPVAEEPAPVEQPAPAAEQPAPVEQAAPAEPPAPVEQAAPAEPPAPAPAAEATTAAAGEAAAQTVGTATS